MTVDMHFLSVRFVCFAILYVHLRADEYVDEVEGSCYKTNQTFSCAKYQLFKYIDSYSLKDINITSDSSVKFVDVPDANISDTAIFLGSRKNGQEDSEFGKIFKFFKRQIYKFFYKQGVAFELPDEARIIEEDRDIGSNRGKKKKGIILPILILIKLCKIKIIVSIILAAVLAIKKMLIVGAFLIPGAIAAIKLHCKSQQQQVHVVPYHHEEEDHHYTHELEHDDDDGYEFISGGHGDKHHYWDRNNRKKYSFL